MITQQLLKLILIITFLFLLYFLVCSCLNVHGKVTILILAGNTVIIGKSLRLVDDQDARKS